MTPSSIQTNFDLKSGVKVTLGFLAISGVLLVLVASLVELGTNAPAPSQTEASASSPAEAPAPSLAETPTPIQADAPTTTPTDATQPETTVLQSRTPEPVTPQATAIADIPAIFSIADAERYRQIFSLQKRGKIAEAQKISAELDNKLLMGHVLAQQLQRQAKPDSRALKDWLRKYSDHPDYGRIKRLAQTRKKRGRKKARPPAIRRNSLMAAPPPSAPYATTKRLTRKQRKRVSGIKRAARIWLRRGQVRRTERLLKRAHVVRLLDRYEMSEARSKIAAAWFYQGKDKRAYSLAAKVIARSGKALPLTHWVAGLSAWRMGKIKQAQAHFETVAQAPELSGWIGAGGALWAARAHKKLGNETETQHWLEQAARHPYTLYGVLALNELGRALPFEPRHHPLTEAKVTLLASTKGGLRALALNEVGELLRAEQELLSLRKWKRPVMQEALRAIADRLQLPSIPIKLVHHQAKDDDDGRADEPLDPAIYPMPPWKPTAKSKIDRALLYAIMRQESDFNAFAHSPVGALGLMQIMPATARMLNRGRRPFSGRRRLDMYDPEIIVKFGQRYLIHLRSHKRVRNNLIRMIAGYNSGPGNIGYWARTQMKYQKDPLLFIEAIPNLETRLFVRRVLANLWIYRARLDQSASSLETFAAGQFPRYSPIDGKKGRKTTGGNPGNPDG
jgi:soluble lytic murein transglycosylase-like protein